MADRNIGYPGHSLPPGSFTSYAVVFLVAAMICGAVSVFMFRVPMLVFAMSLLGGALLSLTYIPEARKLCESSGGGKCPDCGHDNKVTWRS